MKAAITILFLTFSMNTFASGIKIQCESPRGDIILKMTNNHLKIEGRTPAEVNGQRTRTSGKSMTKIFYLGGNKHTLYLENTTSFNAVNDYISIRNRKGHEMTYPMTCSLI